MDFSCRKHWSPRSDSERRWIADRAVYVSKRIAFQLQGQERMNGKGTGQIARLSEEKPKARIVLLMPKHKHDALTTRLQLGQAMPDQVTADLTPLMAGQDGHRSQRDRRKSSFRSLNRHSTEQNMTCNPFLKLCDNR